MRLHYRSKIPLLNGGVPSHLSKTPLAHAIAGTLTRSDIRRVITDNEKRTRRMALIKPGRRLGDAWIDSFVAQRKAVAVCPDCAKKYGDWHVRHHYNKRDEPELNDCDGCGEYRLCAGYYSSIV